MNSKPPPKQTYTTESCIIQMKIFLTKAYRNLERNTNLFS